MISANRTSIPAYLSAVSGNVSDKTSMPEMAQVYLEQFSAEDESPILVADAALYGADTLGALSENKWVTRVPATLTEAKEALAACEQEDMQVSECGGYLYQEMTSEYGGVKQRWLVVFSKARYQQGLAQLEKQIERESEKLVKQIKKLERQTFNCEEDAHKAFSKTAQWKYHTLRGVISAHERYAQPGRPTIASPTVINWQVEVTHERDASKISERHKSLGKYILATNVMDQEELPAEELLTVYKDQNRSVERGFRFLKDPFFASGFFLKKPSRIMGLLMVMGLSLLIYALAEHQLRQQLVAQDQSIPDQKGKPTQNPTMRRVFQIFEGIHVLTVVHQGLRKRMITNIRDVHLQIATLLGNPILKFYAFEDSPL
jgi:transposase